MTPEAGPVDGVAYTPDQVASYGWLGSVTAEAIRKAAQRGEIEHTRLRGKIFLTAGNIRANLTAGLRAANEPKPAGRTYHRTARRPSPAALPPNVEPLRARPKRVPNRPV